MQLKHQINSFFLFLLYSFFIYILYFIPHFPLSIHILYFIFYISTLSPPFLSSQGSTSNTLGFNPQHT